jgi:hypothetical protein
VISKPMRYLFTVEYGMILNDSQTERDPTYRKKNLREYAVDFEATPFLRHPQLERFTLNATARSTQSAYDNDGTNVDFNLVSASLGVNWYPVYSPYTIKAPLLFLGTYFRSGYGQVESPVTNDVGKYTVVAYPALRGGLRYIFNNKIGLRIVASMETLKLERYQVNKLGSALPDRDTLVEGKMGLGLTYSF